LASFDVASYPPVVAVIAIVERTSHCVEVGVCMVMSAIRIPLLNVMSTVRVVARVALMHGYSRRMPHSSGLLRRISTLTAPEVTRVLPLRLKLNVLTAPQRVPEL
jgi:hypothetical protein